MHLSAGKTRSASRAARWLFRAISEAKSTNQQEREILFLGCESEKCGYQFGVKICNEALTLSSNADKPLTEPPLE